MHRTVAGCADDLAGNTEAGVCDATLTFDITAPVKVRYDVFASGPAVVNSVTYTLPSGDETVLNPTLPFVIEEVDFTVSTTGRIRVTGDVATGGEIAFGWLRLPPSSGEGLEQCTG